jgi:predicted ATPase/DNA-binding SARP family transcriptional activator
MLQMDPGEVLRVRMLGPDLRLSVSGKPVTASAAPKTKELLAYVLVNFAAPSVRDEIAASLWPDVREAEGRQNLRRHLSLLQRYLADCCEGTLIVVDGETLRWNLESPTWNDVATFERLARSPGAGAAAAELYGGELLHRLDAEWLEAPRERLRAAMLELLLKLTDSAERFGEISKAARYANQTLRMDPFCEDAVRRVMSYTARLGDRAGALRFYSEFSKRLHDELGVAPMPQTSDLFELLRTNAVPVSLPAQRSAGGSAETDFVGRSLQLDELAGHLGLARLVTVTGPGGMGKSSIARVLAKRLGPEYRDGVRSVSLATASGNAPVLSALVSELGLMQGGEEAMLRAVLAFFAGREMLLVLDNCETQAAACRRFVEALFAACPSVRILATSREPLRVPGERIYRLPPLSTPPRDGMSSGVIESEAAELFLHRARAVAPLPVLQPADLAALREICVRLDGIPLALELAAARCSVLSIREIAARLDDRSLVVDFARSGAAAHQATLRATIAWAYDSLSASDQRGFRALSLFETSFEIGAVERITRDLIAGPAIDFITNIAERSLLAIDFEAGAARYRLLAPIREFAFEAAQKHGESADIARRYVAHYTDLADRLELPEGGARPGAAFDLLERERRNIANVLAIATDLRIEDEAVPDLTLRLSLFWEERGYADEGYWILGGLARRAVSSESARTELRLLAEACAFSRLTVAYDEARSWAKQLTASAVAADDPYSRAEAMFLEGMIQFTVGDSEAARISFHAANAAFSEIGEEAYAARALVDVGLLDLQDGRYDSAAETLGHAVAALATSRRRRWHMVAVSALAYAERFRRNFPLARELSTAALAHARESGNRSLFNTCLSNLCNVALEENDEPVLLGGLQEGLASLRSGAFPFSLVHYIEVASRFCFQRERYSDSLELLAVLKVLLKRFALTPPLEDAQKIRARSVALAEAVREASLEESEREFEAASTEACVDAALRVVSRNDGAGLVSQPRSRV